LRRHVQRGRPRRDAADPAGCRRHAGVGRSMRDDLPYICGGVRAARRPPRALPHLCGGLPPLRAGVQRPGRRDGLTLGVKLGISLGYAPPGTNPADLVPLVQEAERLGYDSAWASEAWGTDAVTVLAWLAASTSRIKLGSAIMQIPGRTPANTAMTAATLDLMSGGRFILGLGTSGPQVVEGWHGEAWGRPLTRTREYVELVRKALRREAVALEGREYAVPYRGDDATGLGKPLKLMLRPLRDAIPI